MTYEYSPRGVCSRKMYLELDEQNVILSLRVEGGCNGNLQGICALVKGMPAEEAVERMSGIRCGFKSTSCPDQIAQALKAALAE